MPVNMFIELNPTTILSPLIAIDVAYTFCGTIVCIHTFVITISTFARMFFAKIKILYLINWIYNSKLFN